MRFTAMIHGVKFKAPSLAAGKSGKRVGSYCGGKDLEKCRKAFGDQLPRICGTCPN